MAPKRELKVKRVEKDNKIFDIKVTNINKKDASIAKTGTTNKKDPK